MDRRLASDKCKYESECLSFGDHMRATTQLWGRHLNKTEGGHYSRQHPTVVFTTEAKSMVEEQQSWVKENEPSNKLPVQFDFVVNEQDILPDSGFIKDIGANRSWLFCSCIAIITVVVRLTIVPLLIVVVAIYSEEKPGDGIRS